MSLLDIVTVVSANRCSAVRESTFVLKLVYGYTHTCGNDFSVGGSKN